RGGVVVAQRARARFLLAAGDVLTRSILHAQQVELGFRPQGVAVLGVELGLIGYDEDKATRLMERAAERVGALPGVQAVSRSVRQPLAINYNRNSVFFPERTTPQDRGAIVAATWIDGQYLSTLGVPLLRGRNFTATDVGSSAKVALVTASIL